MVEKAYTVVQIKVLTLKVMLVVPPLNQSGHCSFLAGLVHNSSPIWVNPSSLLAHSSVPISLSRMQVLKKDRIEVSHGQN